MIWSKACNLFARGETHVKRISIQIKVIAMILALGIILIMTLSMLTGVFFRQVVENQVIPISEKSVKNLALNLNMQTYNYLSTLKQVTSSATVVNMAKRSYGTEGAKMQAISELSSLIAQTNIYERIIWPFSCLVLTRDGTLLTSEGGYSHNDNRIQQAAQIIMEEEFYAQMMKRTSENLWIGIRENLIFSRSGLQLYAVRNIVEDRKTIGVVIFCVDLIYLNSLLRTGTVTEHSNAVLFRENGELIVDSIQKDWQTEGLLNEIQKFSSDDTYVELDGEEYVLITEKISVLDSDEVWTLSVLTPVDELMQELRNVQTLAYVIGGVIILAILAIVTYINRAILRPIVYYGGKVNKIGTDNFNVAIEVVGRNEMEALGSSLKTMVNRIQKGIEELKQREDALRRLEIQTLSAQINPHFIRNTLNSMRAMAEMSNAPVLAESIRSFTKLIDYIFHGNLESTVGAELTCSQDYMYLQNLRYQHKFYFRVDVDERLLEEKMPALIFQPIVENCITHGFWGRKGSGEILLSGREEEGIMVFTVADDGVGIENTDVLERKDKNPHGLSNIHSRIKLLYGQEYGLQISRGEACGTVVKVRIPKGGYNHAENHDRG